MDEHLLVLDFCNSLKAEPPALWTLKELAEHLDSQDELRQYRDRFHIPRIESLKPETSNESQDSDLPLSEVIYLCGNSLGLQPRSVKSYIDTHLDKWANQGVEGHFEEPYPWLTIDDTIVESMARLVGGLPHEVTVMNSLTANLHFMMAAFYRPTPSRNKILIEGKAFPSDIHAVVSQIQHHGYDPATSLVEIYPTFVDGFIEEKQIIDILEEQGESIALVLFSGVQYYTGQYFDISLITKVAQSKGCKVGFDLAHAVGNVPLKLHEWSCDFACWCTYKYLNCGPGSIGGCFVHERHGDSEANLSTPRLAGWWGHRLEDRFLMDGKFVACRGVYGFRVSNPPALLVACVRASLDLFDEAGMDRIRSKSLQLTGFLEFLLDNLLATSVKILSPREPHRRGCQLSLSFTSDLNKVMEYLKNNGVVCDSRKPNVIRIAPCPLYNSFKDVYKFVKLLQQQVNS